MERPKVEWSKEQLVEALSKIGNIDEAIETLQSLRAHPPQTEKALTPRERLIQRAFEISDYEIEAVLDYIDQLEDLADIAVSKSRKDEVGIPFEEAIKDLGLDPERLEKIARDEGWIK